jgi:phospholipid/cholesterol/gamma-HCH transport system substrate-binding protein
LKVSNEVKVGLLTTIAIVMLVLGYNLMRGKNIFSREDVFYVRYNDAGRIAPAGHVFYKGMNVGHVLKSELAKDGSGKIIVSFAINPGLQIPAGSVATIVSPDFISAKAIQLSFSNTTTYLESGDTLVAGYVSNGMQEVQTQAQALIASLDSTIRSVNGIFDSETRLNLQKSVKSIQSTLGTLDKSATTVDKMLADNAGRLDKIFHNVESITGNLNSNQEQINTILGNLSALTDSIKRIQFAATIAEAKESLTEVSQVMNKINSGQGSLGMLVNNDTLYRNLEASSKSLDALLADMKANPNRYVHFSVFGRKD